MKILFATLLLINALNGALYASEPTLNDELNKKEVDYVFKAVEKLTAIGFESVFIGEVLYLTDDISYAGISSQKKQIEAKLVKTRAEVYSGFLSIPSEERFQTLNQIVFMKALAGTKSVKIHGEDFFKMMNPIYSYVTTVKSSSRSVIYSDMLGDYLSLMYSYFKSDEGLSRLEGELLIRILNDIETFKLENRACVDLTKHKHPPSLLLVLSQIIEDFKKPDGSHLVSYISHQAQRLLAILTVGSSFDSFLLTHEKISAAWSTVATSYSKNMDIPTILELVNKNAKLTATVMECRAVFENHEEDGSVLPSSLKNRNLFKGK